MLTLSTKIKIQIASILAKLIRTFYHLIGKKDDIVVVKRKGIHFELDLKEGIDFAIYLGIYEYTTLQAFQNFVKPGDCILDIGANIGAHTLHLAKQVGAQGKVYAFEPTRYAITKLKRNLELNPNLAKSVIAEQIMLSDTDTAPPKSAIYSSWPLEKIQNVHPEHLGNLKSTEGCTAITLDTYIKEKVIEHVQFIKMDVDGFEYKVLKGASHLLKQHRPTILMELAPYVLEEQGNSLMELIELMRENHYTFYPLNSEKELSIEAFKTFLAGKSINIIARVV